MAWLGKKGFYFVKNIVEMNGRQYEVVLNKPMDLSIPLDFHGKQTNAFGVPKATSQAIEVGDFVGDTRKGGSCNCEKVEFVPHCHGTHTEGIGHIAEERISIHKILMEVWIPATLITIEPERVPDTQDSYSAKQEAQDVVITKSSVEKKIENSSLDFLQALAIRTLPNDPEKQWKSYEDKIPPYVTSDAMKYIVSLGVRHLLLDLPSTDRLVDQGKLHAHHIFFSTLLFVITTS